MEKNSVHSFQNLEIQCIRLHPGISGLKISLPEFHQENKFGITNLILLKRSKIQLKFFKILNDRVEKEMLFVLRHG